MNISKMNLFYLYKLAHLSISTCSLPTDMTLTKMRESIKSELKRYNNDATKVSCFDNVCILKSQYLGANAVLQALLSNRKFMVFILSNIFAETQEVCLSIQAIAFKMQLTESLCIDAQLKVISSVKYLESMSCDSEAKPNQCLTSLLEVLTVECFGLNIPNLPFDFYNTIKECYNCSKCGHYNTKEIEKCIFTCNLSSDFVFSLEGCIRNEKNIMNTRMHNCENVCCTIIK